MFKHVLAKAGKGFADLSCRDYRGCAEAIPQALSLSPSTISRRYIKACPVRNLQFLNGASRTKLKELMERKLEGYDITAIVMDGKAFGEDEIIMAAGVTMEGRKVILGIIQSSTENHKVCREFLEGLIDKGLRYAKGLLCVIDGAKGFKLVLAKAGKGYKRGIWHIWSHTEMPMAQAGECNIIPSQGDTGRIQEKITGTAGTYEKTKAALQRIKAELNLINESAVKGLEEGIEETLTILKLRMHKEMLRSFTTTNMIEGIHKEIVRSW